MPSVLDRFLRYVRYDTRSDDGSTSSPSTPGQMVFQRDLVAELRAIGLTDADVDANGYVMATVPATTRKTSVPAIGFIAHVDTSPEMSGTGVTPDISGSGTPAGEISRQWLDSGKLRTSAGWEPRVGLEEGLRRTIAWYREHLRHRGTGATVPQSGHAPADHPA